MPMTLFFDSSKYVLRLKKKLCNAAADRLFEIHHSKYVVGNTFETFGYYSFGSSGDWVKNTHHVKIVLEVELGDSGRYGLAVPALDILNICEETIEGLRTILKKRNDTISKRSVVEEPKNWMQIETVKDSKNAGYVIYSKKGVIPKFGKKSAASRNACSLPVFILSFLFLSSELLFFY